MNDFPQEFIAGLTGLKPHHQGCVATIGSFDGVHLGHQAILQRLREVAKQLRLPTLVMVFEPQPPEYFSREQAPARLMRLREKVDALFRCGIDRVLCLRFNEHLRTLSAEAFIRDILVDRLDVKHLEIGDDFRFGCGRTGDFALLQQAGAHYGFEVRDTQTYVLQGERVSSTRVRRLLEAGEFHEAAALLGRPFSLTGRVVHGKRLGRTLNVPTANINLGRYRSPVNGVYTVKASIPAGKNSTQQWDGDSPKQWNGVANVGVRPTVNGTVKPVLEVHLLDFSGDLYGQWLRVEFCHKLRDEQKFPSLEELKRQIDQDVLAARQYFSNPI
ncbi:bifunctional riboflavin kinase/FAD synthetase [Saccharophagus sp. K07]|uniref:bifunctional riboflavin kinase/FAD synthetase n=1 Tax=Saccharophagus sp. K07 TaxID=2283636 RepID=UPI0016529037|nr:bifunctional riboflavin kinase/FAD synthetase [Saccharophagus sp. K07]MBC6905553.1 bifunctional riboflavin kinase/FAD synthetase [Saccharophagus sp. K07]